MAISLRRWGKVDARCGRLRLRCRDRAVNITLRLSLAMGGAGTKWLCLFLEQEAVVDQPCRCFARVGPDLVCADIAFACSAVRSHDSLRWRIKQDVHHVFRRFSAENPHSAYSRHDLHGACAVRDARGVAERCGEAGSTHHSSYPDVAIARIAWRGTHAARETMRLSPTPPRYRARHAEAVRRFWPRAAMVDGREIEDLRACLKSRCFVNVQVLFRDGN